MSTESTLTPGDSPNAKPQVKRSRTRSETEFTVAAGPAEVRTRIEGIARTLPQFELTSIEPFAAHLSRRTNLFTWGATVTIRWLQNGQGVDVSIVTDAKFPTAFGDYGQGRRDIETMVGALIKDETPVS